MKKRGKRSRRSEGRSGSALLLTLLVITTLTALTLGFSEESGVELTLAGFSRDRHRACLAARASARLALAVLGRDENKEVDSLNEEWAQFKPEPLNADNPEEDQVTGRIVDESGKFNINILLKAAGEIDDKQKERLASLFKVLEIPEKALIPVLDWLDADDIERLDGAEASYYRGLETPYECGNGPFLTVGQIFLVKGLREIRKVGDEGEKDLLDFLTVESDGKININTAPLEVLQALSGKLDASMAQSIVEYRQGKEFANTDELKDIPGFDDIALFDEIKTWITVKSAAFSIEVEGTWLEAKSRVRAVARREEDSVRLVYWQVL